MITKKYLPFILCLGLMLLHFISGYPGGMSPDTIDQYQQSISGNFNSHHPPLMAIIWSLVNYIYRGPQLMLLMQLLFFWGGVCFLYYSDTQNKFRWLYFFIPLLPPVLSQSAMLWKDVILAFSSLLIVAVCIFYSYKNKKAPVIIICGLCLLSFYIVGVKFQAKFIIPIVIYFITSICSSNFITRIITTIILTCIIILGNFLLSKHYSTNTHSEQMRQFFDISGIAVRANNDNVFPLYVKESEIYNFDRLKANYTSKWVDPLIFPEDRIYKSTNNEGEINALNSAFFESILNHPIKYLTHRIMNFSKGLLNYKFHTYSIIVDNKAELLGIKEFKNNIPQKLVKRYLNAFCYFLTPNLIAFVIIIIYIFFILKNYNSECIEITILKYIVSICITYLLVLFFTTMASDYRYYYIVRVLSFFSLPIYFKALYTKSKNMSLIN